MAALWSRACAWLQGTPRTARWVFAVQAALVFVLGGALLMTFAPQPYQTMSRPDTQVALNSQVHALGFYGAQGFEAEGPVYEEAGIPHQVMRLKLR